MFTPGQVRGLWVTHLQGPDMNTTVSIGFFQDN